MHTQTFGRWGEKFVCAWLVGRGCTILERNLRFPFGELDIVAMTTKQTLLVVEVKTRMTCRQGRGSDAITPHKRNCLSLCVRALQQRHPESRIQAVLAEVYPTKKIRLYHLELSSW